MARYTRSRLSQGGIGTVVSTLPLDHCLEALQLRPDLLSDTMCHVDLQSGQPLCQLLLEGLEAMGHVTLELVDFAFYLLDGLGVLLLLLLHLRHPFL